MARLPGGDARAIDEPMREMRETADMLRDAADFTGDTKKAAAKNPTAGVPATPDAADAPPDDGDGGRRPLRRRRSFDRRAGRPRRRRPRRRARRRRSTTSDGSETTGGSRQPHAQRGRRAPATATRRGRTRAHEPPSGAVPRPTCNSRRRMTLTEHLAELRIRIIRCALAVVIAAIVIIVFYDQVLDFLSARTRPVRAAGGRFCGAITDASGEPTWTSSIRSEGFSHPPARRHLRRPDPRHAGDPVADLALRRARPARQGEEVRDPVHPHLGPAVPPRCGCSPT